MNKIDSLPTIHVTKRRGTMILGPINEEESGKEKLPIMFTMTFGTPDDNYEVAEDPDSVIVNLEGKLQIDFGQVARLEIKLEQNALIHQEIPREEQE